MRAQLRVEGGISELPFLLIAQAAMAPQAKTAQEAKERLQFILFHDRIDLPPEQLEEMKKEILQVISKYVSVEQDRVDIALQQRQRDSTTLGPANPA